MFKYENEHLGGARTREEMFKEEQLIVSQKILDKLTELCDLLKPVPKVARIEKTVPDFEPGSIIEIDKPIKTRRAKKEVIK